MKIKTSAVLLIATALALCGCVSGWSRGKVVVNIHAPSQLDDQPARIYYNGLLGFVTRDRTNNVAYLIPGNIKVRVEMDGTEPMTQIVKV